MLSCTRRLTSLASAASPASRVRVAAIRGAAGAQQSFQLRDSSRCVASPGLSPCSLTGDVSARGFHVSSVPEFVFKKRFFKKFFRRRVHPTDLPQDPMKLTLFNQWMIPEDLQLPKPADPLRRIAAGMADAIIAAAAGGAVGGALYAVGLANVAVATEVGQGVALLAWVVRDALGDGGNRSWGKRMAGLELAFWDGTLPSQRLALTRNAYWLVLPAMTLHPLASMAGSVLLAFDAASVLLTADARKVGDYATGLRVVDARAGRDIRLLDAEEAEEIRALREEVEARAPGFLKASTHPDDAWYEDERDRTMSSAEIIRTAQGRALPGAGVGLGAGMAAASAAATPGAPSSAAATATSNAPGELPFDPALLQGGFSRILSNVRSDEDSDPAVAAASTAGAKPAAAAAAAAPASESASQKPKPAPVNVPKHGFADEKQRKR